MSAPAVSVLLLTRDAMPALPGLLARLRAQEMAGGFEIVAVDTCSRDGSAELLSREADRVLSVEPEAFGHGRTRNLGIAACRGSRVALLVQDALPASTRWLAELVAPLDADPTVAGAFSRQVPARGASALARRQLAGWVAAGDAPRCARLDRAGLARLAPLERLAACAFDDVSACVRREVWERHPFPEVAIAEDLAWSREVLLAGFGIAFAPASVVEHSHDRSLRYELERTRRLHEELARLFGVATVPSLAALARAVAATLPEHLRCLAADARRGGSGPGEWLRVLGLAFVWPLGQYLGARLAGRS